MAQAWKDDDFGFCTDTNAKVNSAGGGEQIISMSDEFILIRLDTNSRLNSYVQFQCRSNKFRTSS